jgi:hypothetical protein
MTTMQNNWINARDLKEGDIVLRACKKDGHRPHMWIVLKTRHSTIDHQHFAGIDFITCCGELNHNVFKDIYQFAI